MQAEMQPHWEVGDAAGSSDTGNTGNAIRLGLAQELLRASTKDCNNSRDRFIPREELNNIVNADCVGQILQRIPGRCAEDENYRQEVVQLICPGPGECFCGCGHCMGLRMILATLLLFGREDLILSFSSPEKLQGNPRVCDNDLTDLFKLPQGFHYGFRPDEIDLFTHLRWQVYTPFLTSITSARKEHVPAFPKEASLPWTEKARFGEPATGEVSYVEKIAIHHLNHDLTLDKDTLFALKTFEKSRIPGLAEETFLQEVEANLDAPKHDRIVRLLTAFSYRQQYYLLFPYASEGSLETLWSTYNPEDTHWYSDGWLIGECFGITQALVATHGLGDDRTDEVKGLLHLDIKPENILCFPSSNLGRPSIVLKLADFGEAQRFTSDLKADKAPHVLTYRPPEHSKGNTITPSYDVWCLGCLFLDFVNWAIFGQGGMESFDEARAEEPDDAGGTENPGNTSEDTFFKTVKQGPVPFIPKRLHWGYNRKIKVASGRVTTTYSLSVASHVNTTTRLKNAVLSRLSTLREHSRCSGQLRSLLCFIGDRMLVVDPAKRANSREVCDFLSNLVVPR